MSKRHLIGNTILIVGLLAAGTSFADDTTTTAPAQNLPGDRGLASVNRNLEKNPDNRGLQNASEQLNQNQIRHAEQMKKRVEKREAHTETKTERIQTRAERHEAMDRPARVERPGR